MPIYVFKCPKCLVEREIIVPYPHTIGLQFCCVEGAWGDPDSKQPGSAIVMDRIPAPTAFHLKGAGWTPKGPGRRV